MDDAEAVCVLGAGTMGRGIAHACATAGHRVRLRDGDADALAAASDAVRGTLDGGVERGKLSGDEADAAFARLETTTDLAAAAGAADVLVEAADSGLVEEAVPAADLDERVDELAGRMAEKSPLALRRAKEAVRGAADRSLREGLEYERELFVGLFDSHDKDEGIDAFYEGRDPTWRGE